MKYRQDKYGNKISQLGYGCMRFTKKGGSADYEKAEAEVLRAIELGVNYFDTAYIYPGNEECLGKILANNHVREKINIATKLPQYMIKTKAAIDRTFEEELRRLQTDYIDYYLMHMLNDPATWQRLTDLGIQEWIREKKESGAIKNIGFSFHDNAETLEDILKRHPEFEFVQLQINYLDWESEGVQSRKCYETAVRHHVPVFVMEPVKGGTLANVPDEVEETSIRA